MANRTKKPVELWTEREHQQELVKWFREHFSAYANLLIAPMNDAVLPGARSDKARHVASMRAMGMQDGVADLILLLPRRKYSFLCIELKLPERRAEKNGGLSQAQLDFEQAVLDAGGGYFTKYGYEDAMQLLLDYVNGL